MFRISSPRKAMIALGITSLLALPGIATAGEARPGAVSAIPSNCSVAYTGPECLPAAAVEARTQSSVPFQAPSNCNVMSGPECQQKAPYGGRGVTVSFVRPNNCSVVNTGPECLGKLN